MPDPQPSPSDDQLFLSRALEATIRIGLVLILVAWCFEILRPFVIPVIWAVIIAVAVNPAYLFVRRALGERNRAAALLATLLGLAVLLVPAVLLGGTLVEGVQTIAAGLRDETLAIPPPPDGIADWPLVGPALAEFWKNASVNLASLARSFGPQLVEVGSWLLASAAGAGFVFLQSLVSVLVAGVLLANGERGASAALAISQRLAGERGVEFAQLASATVRSVAQGILGVALLQSFLAGIGFLVVGVPAAGLWALIGLLFCVIQVGLFPVMIPVVIYIFATADPVTAVLFTTWGVVVSLLDNVLKPMLLGRGVKVPTLVIFLGSIGGFISSGIIGLFVGSVVLVLGYTLLLAWLGALEEGETSGAAPAD